MRRGACGKLIVDPPAEKIDSSSIDLYIDAVEEAKIWDLDAYNKDCDINGNGPSELRIGKFQYPAFSGKYLIAPPEDSNRNVYRRGRQVVVKPSGFLLWQTKEKVGTPEEGAGLICFIDGKSTRARTGLLVHLTAPTIHASWSGKITLEIANLGPFHFVLEENDVIAQIVVSTVSSIPANNMKKSGSVTFNQANVTGLASKK